MALTQSRIFDSPAAAFANQMRAIHGEFSRRAFNVSTAMFAPSPEFSLMAEQAFLHRPARLRHETAKRRFRRKA